MRRLFRSLAVAVVVVAGLTSCDAPSGDGTEGEGETAEGEGESSVDLGCDGDDACADGLVCDLPTGTCVAGFDCSVNTTICEFCGDTEVNCGFGSADAFCDVEHGGVCRRTKGACAPCTDDNECAEGSSGLASVCSDGFCAPGCGPCGDGFQCVDGGCAPLPGTTSSGTCDGAILCGDGTTCPDGETCSDSGVCLRLCDVDVDCPTGTICQADGPTQHTCVSGCPFATTVEQDGVDLICHGDGRFGLPCTTPGSSEGCPSSTECTASGACDLAGCQRDDECPLPRTYCDVPSATCKNGCNDDSDCGAFELCDVATHVCEPQGCRGKETSCNNGEFCCGKELYSDDSTCPAPVADGECFLAPDPFCRTCADDDDCADISAFGFGSFCYEIKREDPNTGEEVNFGKFCSVGCSSNNDCPRGLRCIDDLPTPDGGTTSGCLEALCAGFADARQ